MGYVNRPAKEDALRTAGADVVIRSMAELANVVLERVAGS